MSCTDYCVSSTLPQYSNEVCVNQAVLKCINDLSNYWPKCDSSQSKSNTGPSGYSYGQYCTSAWADSLNEMLVNTGQCTDTDMIAKVLAQVAYETGYFTTVHQPADDGAGLIHMIPGNFAKNAKDMDCLYNTGTTYQDALAVFVAAGNQGADFFKNASYGWRSVAAWFKKTNKVISGCGKDLFSSDVTYATMGKCIYGASVGTSRNPLYNAAKTCIAAQTSSSSGSTGTGSTCTGSGTENCCGNGWVDANTKRTASTATLCDGSDAACSPSETCFAF